MSTARIDNIGPSAGGTTRKLVRGTAAAWANLNGTGTIALRDSENVSSVVDNGTGDYTLNFSNGFNAVGYAVTAEGSGTGAGSTAAYRNATVNIWPDSVSNSNLKTSQDASSSGGNLLDFTFVCVAIHGDLA